MLTQVLRKLMAVTACGQQNTHPHLHISISSPLHPVVPLHIPAKWKQNFHAVIYSMHAKLGVGHKDYAHWLLDCVCQENAGSVPILHKIINDTSYNKFSLGQSHSCWSNQHLIQWKAPLAVKVTEYSPISTKSFCNGTSCLPVLLNFML